MEPGATAVDDIDCKVSVSISGTVDSGTLGSYTITYRAVDKVNNTGTATRTVTVIVDTTPPTFTLNGDNPLMLYQGNTYVEQGATAIDDMDATVSLSISGMVDTNTTGSYGITYSAPA